MSNQSKIRQQKKTNFPYFCSLISPGLQLLRYLGPLLLQVFIQLISDLLPQGLLIGLTEKEKKETKKAS